jgi:hypothetical protein
MYLCHLISVEANDLVQPCGKPPRLGGRATLLQSDDTIGYLGERDGTESTPLFARDDTRRSVSGWLRSGQRPVRLLGELQCRHIMLTLLRQ